MLVFHTIQGVAVLFQAGNVSSVGVHVLRPKTQRQPSRGCPAVLMLPPSYMRDAVLLLFCPAVLTVTTVRWVCVPW